MVNVSIQNSQTTDDLWGILKHAILRTPLKTTYDFQLQACCGELTTSCVNTARYSPHCAETRVSNCKIEMSAFWFDSPLSLSVWDSQTLTFASASSFAYSFFGFNQCQSTALNALWIHNRVKRRAFSRRSFNARSSIELQGTEVRLEYAFRILGCQLSG